MQSGSFCQIIAQASRSVKAPEMPPKILIVSADHHKLKSLEKEACDAGYSTIATKPEGSLALLLACQDATLVVLDMRHSRERCALGHLLKWCFPRVSLMLISASVSDRLVCDTCPATCHSATAKKKPTTRIRLTAVLPPAIKDSS